jgi:hypothetical protein
VLPQGWKGLTSYAKVEIYVNNGIKMSEQPLIINDLTVSKPTHLGGLRRFIALLTSAAETGAVGKYISVMTEYGGVTVGQDVLKIDLKLLLKASIQFSYLF